MILTNIDDAITVVESAVQQWTVFDLVISAIVVWCVDVGFKWNEASCLKLFILSFTSAINSELKAFKFPLSFSLPFQALVLSVCPRMLCECRGVWFGIDSIMGKSDCPIPDLHVPSAPKLWEGGGSARSSFQISAKCLKTTKNDARNSSTAFTNSPH